MKKFLSLVIITSAVFIMSSCHKSFLTSLAVNPNSPSGGTPELILPGVLNSITFNVSGLLYSDQAVWLGYWNYSGGYTYFTDQQTYKVTSGGPQSWGSWYGPLSNITIMMDLAKQPHYEEYAGIGEILEALCFQYLVDDYNMVPYSQAMKGVGEMFPVYDPGQSVYKGIVAQIDTGMTLIEAGMADPQVVNPGSVSPAPDIMFGGNMKLWLAFANSLKLRILVRESNVLSSGTIQAELVKTASYGYLGLGQDALVNPGYINADGKQNPIWSSLGTNAASALHTDGYNLYKAGKYAMDFYKNTNDPRLAYFYTPNGVKLLDPNYSSPTVPADTSKFSADPLGVQEIHGGSNIGPGVLKGATAPGVVMTASESLFLQAEAAARGYISGDAQQLYQQGITASFEYLGVSSSSENSDQLAADYYNQTGVTNVSWPSSPNAQIEAILTQKWAALNGISVAESWNDWRRTGYPIPAPNYANTSLNPNPHPLAGPHMPYRYFYPDVEFSTNQDQLNKATGGKAIDPYNDKIFWMPQ